MSRIVDGSRVVRLLAAPTLDFLSAVPSALFGKPIIFESSSQLCISGGKVPKQNSGI